MMGKVIDMFEWKKQQEDKLDFSKPYDYNILGDSGTITVHDDGLGDVTITIPENYIADDGFFDITSPKYFNDDFDEE